MNKFYYFCFLFILLFSLTVDIYCDENYREIFNSKLGYIRKDIENYEFYKSRIHVTSKEDREILKKLRETYQLLYDKDVYKYLDTIENNFNEANYIYCRKYDKSFSSLNKNFYRGLFYIHFFNYVRYAYPNPERSSSDNHYFKQLFDEVDKNLLLSKEEYYFFGKLFFAKRNYFYAIKCLKKSEKLSGDELEKYYKDAADDIYNFFCDYMINDYIKSKYNILLMLYDTSCDYLILEYYKKSGVNTKDVVAKIANVYLEASKKTDDYKKIVNCLARARNFFMLLKENNLENMNKIFLTYNEILINKDIQSVDEYKVIINNMLNCSKDINKLNDGYIKVAETCSRIALKYNYWGGVSYRVKEELEFLLKTAKDCFLQAGINEKQTNLKIGDNILYYIGTKNYKLTYELREYIIKEYYLKTSLDYKSACKRMADIIKERDIYNTLVLYLKSGSNKESNLYLSKYLGKDSTKEIIFKPTTIYTYTIDKTYETKDSITLITIKNGVIQSYYFLIGETSDGKKIAFDLGATEMDFGGNRIGQRGGLVNDPKFYKIFFDSSYCENISDIKKYGYITWYKILENSKVYYDKKNIQKYELDKYNVDYIYPFEKIWELLYPEDRDDINCINIIKKYITFKYIPPISHEEILTK